LTQVLTLFSSYRFPTARFVEQYIERHNRPLLVIHGDADTIIPYAAGKRVFDKARTVRKTLVTIPGADHNDLDAVNPDVYWRAIHAFVAGLGPPVPAGP
jgi:fermentation-respiration switch protein FrsA (DUF1100 family)